MRTLLVLAGFLAACSSGAAGSGGTLSSTDPAPISGEAPPISGEAPPATEANPNAGQSSSSGGAPGADLKCGGKYTCTITLNGKTQTDTDTLKCEEYKDGNVLDDNGNQVARYTVDANGTVTITGTIDGKPFSYTCVPAK